MDTSQPTQLDPDVVTLTKAIRQVESGNDFSARSKDGSFGAYQFIKPTWDATAKKYGVDVPWEQATPQQQNEVAYKQVKDWKDAGYNVGQIASMWNAGAGRPDAYKENLVGTNSSGVNYNTPAYAQKVATAYHQIKGTPPAPASPDPAAVDNNAPIETPLPAGQGHTVAGNIIRGLVRPLVRAVNTPIEGVQKLLGSDTSNETDPYLGDVSGYGMKDGQTTGQRVKDAVGGALETGALLIPGLGEAAEGAEALSAGAKIAGAAKTGALVGAAGGAGNTLTTNPDATGKDVAVSGVEGGLAGGFLGGIAGAAAPALEKIKSSLGLSSKTLDEVLATAPEDVHKLSTVERKAYFDAQKEIVSQQYKATTEAVSKKLQQQSEQAISDVKQLSQQVDSSSREEAIALKPKVLSSFRKQSDTYAKIVEEEIAKAPVQDVNKQELLRFMESKFEEDPDQLALAKSQLGLAPAEEGAEPEKTTLQDLYQKTKELRQGIGKAGTTGGRVYTPQEYATDKNVNALLEFMKGKDVDLSEANQFWSKWAPVRNRIVRELKPFDSEGITKIPFAKTIQGKTADAQAFVKTLQDTLGEEIGPKTKESLGLLDEAKQAKIQAKIDADTAKLEAKLAKAKTSGKLKADQFEAERKAEIKKITKRAILIGLGIVGAGAGGRKIVEHLL